MTILQHRYDLVGLIEVESGNPNGDPDANNAPRTYPDGRGFITDVCVKRKIRNRVSLARAQQPGDAIFITQGAVLQTKKRAAYDALGLPVTEKRVGAEVDRVRDFMCREYWDVRTFGAVMAQKVSAGSVKGPVQLSFPVSVDPISFADPAITRGAVETQEESDQQKGDNRTMGRKHAIPYGLYKFTGSISVSNAIKTGFTQDDLDTFRDALMNMFEDDASSSRPLMGVPRVVAFRHDRALGSGKRMQLLKRLKVSLRDPKVPATAYEDYDVTLDLNNLPTGITVEEWD
jgi:CRISPR-associated protein Csd2